MFSEWDNLRVCGPCLDPRPPEMEPPDVYPEGIPFLDARVPQDNPDRLTDDTMLQSVTGGMLAPYGVINPGGQNQGPGAISPLPIESTPGVTGPAVLEDDVTFRTGPVA